MKKGFIFPIAVAVLALVALLLLFPPVSGGEGSLPTPTATPTQTPIPTTVPPTTAPPPEPAQGVLEAPYAFVYDSTEPRMYYVSGGAQTRIAPASLTKLLTAVVALEVLDADTVITAGEELSLVAANSSLAYISRGQKLRVETLVEGMLLQSGNDAAYILAVAAGREIANNPKLSAKGALRRFVEHMNYRALEMGMVNTHFENPDGIDGEDHYTCLQDLALLSVIAMEEPLICKYVSMDRDYVTFHSGETITWENTNELLHRDSEYYCAEAVGLKTGTTTKAGNCLISAFPRGDGYLLIGVLGGGSYYGRYKDTLYLYELYSKYGLP